MYEVGVLGAKAPLAQCDRTLEVWLGLSVTVDHREQGGRLEIRYKTLEQLDNLCVRLTGH